MQGLRFNSSLLFLHTVHDKYALVLHGMIKILIAILTKREGTLHYFRRTISFGSVSDNEIF